MSRAPCSIQENNPNAACRIYVHTPGRVLVFFRYALRVCTKEKAQSRTAQQNRKNDENETEFRKEKKIPAPSLVIFFCLIETPRNGLKKQKTANFLPQPRTPPVRFASASPPIRSGQTFLPLCQSEPRPRLAFSPLLTLALVRQFDNLGAQTA